MNKEKVIIRREYDPYMKIWKWLCIFPETYEGNNTWGCVAIWKDKYNHWWHDPYTSGTVSYFYKCKIVHKNAPEVAEVIEGLKKLYGGEYEVVEKMNHRLKTYQIKANIGDTVDELGPFVNDETRWTMKDVKEDAMNYEMTVEEFIERYLEEVK